MLNEFRPLVIKAGDQQIGEDARVRVQGSKNMTLLSDFFLFEIYNMSDTDFAAVNNNKMMYAYGMDGRLICCGEIDEIYTKVDNTNLVTSISVIDGKSFWETRVNKSFGGGTTISTTFRGLIQNASVGAFTAPDLRMIRGQTYTGRLAESISELAKSVHGRAYITNNTVYVTAKGRSSEIVYVNSEDVIEDRNSGSGLRIVKTIMKGYPIGTLVSLSNNQYRLVSQKISADNYKGSWDSILVLVDESVLPYNGMEGG